MASEVGIHDQLESEDGAWARRHMIDDVVGGLTTVAPGGRVQTSAISFLWDDRTILFYNKPNTPKLRNIVQPQLGSVRLAIPVTDSGLTDPTLAIRALSRSQT